MDKEEFLQRRKIGIGGSDIAAIIGISPWKSPRDIYLNKKGLSQPEPETDAMYWGTTLEEVVAKEYSKRSGRKIERCNIQLQHKEYPFLVGNVDRLVYQENNKKPLVKGELRTNRILECKTSSQYASSEWGEEGTQDIPEYYKAQVQWYMGITGAEFCDVAVLIGNRDFRMYEITRNDEVINYLFSEGIKFWNDYVLTEVMPPARTLEDVENIFKGEAKVRKFADDEIIEAVNAYVDLDSEEKRIKEEKELIKVKICDYIGDAVDIVTPDSKKLCSWSAAKPTIKTDWKSVAEALNADQETIAKYTTEAMSSRRFTITRK